MPTLAVSSFQNQKITYLPMILRGGVLLLLPKPEKNIVMFPRKSDQRNLLQFALFEPRTMEKVGRKVMYLVS